MEWLYVGRCGVVWGYLGRGLRGLFNFQKLINNTTIFKMSKGVLFIYSGFFFHIGLDT